MNVRQIKKFKIELEEIKKEFKELHMTILNDLIVLNERLIDDPLNQCWIRLFIRTLYSDIEAICYIWKQRAYLKDTYDYLSGKIKKRNLIRSEIALILEESYYLASNGKAKVRSYYSDAVRNFRFAFDIYARIMKLDFKLDFSEKGWRSFQKGLEIRNRITHPKNISDLFISDSDNDLIHEVLEWFYSTLILMGLKKDKKNLIS